MDSNKEFKEFIINKLKGLSKPERRKAIDGLMQSFQEALAQLGIGMLFNGKHLDPDSTVEEASKHLDFLLELEKEMKEFIDNNDTIPVNDEEKVIGDSVILVDKYAGCYIHDYETKKQLSENHNLPLLDLTETPGIVIKKEEFIFNCGHCPNEHDSDLVVYFPSVERKFHINSRLVKILKV